MVSLCRILYASHLGGVLKLRGRIKLEKLHFQASISKLVVIIKKGEIVEASFNPKSILMKTTCINAKREELQRSFKHQSNQATYA
jgi:hypothetical protein